MGGCFVLAGVASVGRVTSRKKGKECTKHQRTGKGKTVFSFRFPACPVLLLDPPRPPPQLNLMFQVSTPSTIRRNCVYVRRTSGIGKNLRTSASICAKFFFRQSPRLPPKTKKKENKNLLRIHVELQVLGQHPAELALSDERVRAAVRHDTEGVAEKQPPGRHMLPAKIHLLFFSAAKKRAAGERRGQTPT